MNILMALIVAATSGSATSDALGTAPPARLLCQDGSNPTQEGQDRVVIQKTGGPGRGADQPFSVREQGAKDLEGFVGGKYVVIEGGGDFVLLALVVIVVVVLIIII